MRILRFLWKTKLSFKIRKIVDILVLTGWENKEIFFPIRSDEFAAKKNNFFWLARKF